MTLNKEFRHVTGKEPVPAWRVEGAPKEGMYRFNPYPEFAQRNLASPAGRFWVNDDGDLHRWHGPAVEMDNGIKEWCLYGMLMKKNEGMKREAHDED